MTQRKRFPVVLFWHMHQPQYRDALSGEYILPWTYLHAIKDYVDMAAHLEACPGARCVVNFAPILLEQLEELAARVQSHLRGNGGIPDAVLRMLSAAPLPVAPAERLALVRACLRAEPTRLVARFPEFARLAKLAEVLGTEEGIAYASDQYLHDLATWYHLAWLGETVRRDDARVARLEAHGRDYTAAHRRVLLELIGELLAGVLPRYRALAASGQVELSMSPYSHPILPLLIDFKAARESQPASPLPAAPGYPGGAGRAAWHMREGLAVFERVFGRKPTGCWPSEGAISAPALDEIARHGIQWIATGGAVLHGCLANGAGAHGGGPVMVAGAAPELGAWAAPGNPLHCWFRHDGLSDLVGFTYSKWHGDDAVANFIHELERLADSAGGREDAMALVALDGENAWEYFPFNGYWFLRRLYEQLAAHPRFELATLGELSARGARREPLPRVVAGSWVHGTLSTWMGDRDKNAGWDLLVEAKQAADEVLASRGLAPSARHAIERQLAQCESSDWFWWFGDYNPGEAVRDFDRLYRHQLASLYRLLGREAPSALDRPLSVGRGAPEGGGVMRRAQ